MDVGRLTLWPFSPGRPGSPSKPLSPCTSTDQRHDITSCPSRAEAGAVRRFTLRTLPWILTRRASHVHRHFQVGPETKESMKKEKQAGSTNPKACLLTLIDLYERDISCNCPAAPPVLTKAPLLAFPTQSSAAADKSFLSSLTIGS